MIAPKTIRLPRPRELQSNNLTDIQIHLEKLNHEIISYLRYLRQDVTTIQVDDDGWIYFGGKDTNGSWRIGRSGTAWNAERREAGAYVAKGAATA